MLVELRCRSAQGPRMFWREGALGHFLLPVRWSEYCITTTWSLPDNAVVNVSAIKEISEITYKQAK